MGNDLNSWRAAIGLHHGRGYRYTQGLLFKINLCDMITVTVLQCYCIGINMLKAWSVHVMNDAISLQFLISISLICLLKAGDVELNPGPDHFHGDHNLSIIHCNIRSVRNKLDFIRDYFSDFNVLCFTESHLNQDVSTNDILISQSFDTPYRKDRTNHGGGILVYLNKNIIHSRLPELETFCDESIWVKIKTKQELLLLGVFYSPKTADRNFFAKLNLNLEKV